MRIYQHSQPSRKMVLSISAAYTRSIGKIDDPGACPPCPDMLGGYTPKSFLERGEADPQIAELHFQLVKD